MILFYLRPKRGEVGWLCQKSGWWFLLGVQSSVQQRTRRGFWSCAVSWFGCQWHMRFHDWAIYLGLMHFSECMFILQYKAPEMCWECRDKDDRMLTQNHDRRLTSWTDTNFAVKANTITDPTFPLKISPFSVWHISCKASPKAHKKSFPRFLHYPSNVPYAYLLYLMWLWFSSKARN